MTVTIRHRESHRTERPLITSCRVEQSPGHDHVHVWNRGGKSGVLTVNKGDGEAVARRLVGEAAERTEGPA